MSALITTIYKLCKTNITILPRSAWQQVTIEENHEPLVPLIETQRLKTGKGIIDKGYETSFLVRKTIAEKLYKVSERLPKGICLLVIEGFRSLQHQQASWDNLFQKLKQENSKLDDEVIEKSVRLVIAKPSPLANHNCGGAIDVTLCDEQMNVLDMGTPYPSEAMSIDWHSKFKMFSDEITEIQKENRKILREAMEREDFVWYPGEWWHYCYGDRMWAVYSSKTECFYGPVH